MKGSTNKMSMNEEETGEVAQLQNGYHNYYGIQSKSSFHNNKAPKHS